MGRQIRTLGGLWLVLLFVAACDSGGQALLPPATGSGGAPLSGGFVATGGMFTGGFALPSGGALTGGMASGGALATGGQYLPTGGAATGGQIPAAGGDTPTTGGDMPATGGVVTDPTACKWTRGAAPTEASILGTARGPYQGQTYSIGFNAGAGVTSATVHYPSDAEPPFAGVAVVPGYQSPESSIRAWGPFLASHGIVAVTIGVPGNDNPSVRSRKLMSTLAGLQAENTRAESPLVGKIALDCLGVSGWSMGGGGTLIAAASNPDLKAAVSFAAWQPTGGGMNRVPALMFQATADILAANMSDVYYQQTPDSTPKMLFEVQGSSHSVANDPANHSGVIGAYGLSWWKLFLEGDERYRQYLTRPFPSIVTSKSETNLN